MTALPQARALPDSNFGQVISCSHSFYLYRHPLRDFTRVARRTTGAQRAGSGKYRTFRASVTSSKPKAGATESDIAKHKVEVSIVAVMPAHQQHSLGAPWHEVMSHVADRLAWEDPGFQLQVFTEESLATDAPRTAYSRAIQQAHVVLVLDIPTSANLDLLLDGMRRVPTAIALGSHPQLEALTRLNTITLTSPWEKAAAATLPWSNSAKAAKVLQSVRDVYKRQTSDDLLFMLLVLIDAYITEASTNLQSMYGPVA